MATARFFGRGSSTVVEIGALNEPGLVTDVDADAVGKGFGPDGVSLRPNFLS